MSSADTWQPQLRHARSAAAVLAAIDGQTIPSLFAGIVGRSPDAAALRWQSEDAQTWQQWTWAEYADRAARLAAALQALGVRRGDRVALMMRNRPEFHPADMAVYLAGGASFSIYNSSSIEQVAYALDHSEAVVAIVGEPDLFGVVDAARSSAPNLRHVITVDEVHGDAGVHHWEDLLQTAPLDLAEAAARTRPDDVATFIYTSGTTGHPKAVMLTHQNVCAAVEALVTVLDIELEGRRMVSYLPMAHIAERLLTHYLPVRTGVVTHPWPDTATIGEYLPSVRPEVFFGPPRIFEKLCSTMRSRLGSDAPSPSALCRSVGIDACRIAFTGAAPPPLDVIDFFGRVGTPLAEFYGLSETTGMLAGAVADSRPGTVGRPIAGCEVRLADDHEVLCRGPFVFAGYFKDPDRTAEVLDADGWLHTGDIGEIRDGHLRIVDRKKELIVTSGGKNVSPANLENALKGTPLVGQACVVGDGRPYLTALLVLDADAAITWASAHGYQATSPADVARLPAVHAQIDNDVAQVNAGVSNPERIKKFMVIGDEWLADSDVLTPTMKLKRRGVLERYRAEIDAMYA